MNRSSGPGGHRRAQHPPLRGVQVLRLVDHDVVEAVHRRGPRRRAARAARAHTCRWVTVPAARSSAENTSTASQTRSRCRGPSAEPRPRRLTSRYAVAAVADPWARTTCRNSWARNCSVQGRSSRRQHPPPDLPLVGVADRGRRPARRGPARCGARRRSRWSPPPGPAASSSSRSSARFSRRRRGQGVGVRGEQHPAVRRAGQQVLDPVQGDHRLAGARPAGDLRRPVVGDPVGDPPLRRVQEHPPGGERLLQDLGELVRPA